MPNTYAIIRTVQGKIIKSMPELKQQIKSALCNIQPKNVQQQHKRMQLT